MNFNCLNVTCKDEKGVDGHGKKTKKDQEAAHRKYP